MLGGLVTMSVIAYAQPTGITQNTSFQTGFNNTSPSNRVEIRTNTGDPGHGSANGSSGLRFTNLNSSHTAITGTGKVLSVNTSGDVILVNDQTGSGTFGGAQNGCSTVGGSIVELGNAWGGTSANLLSHREVPQNNFSLLFSGNQLNDRIKIGGSSTSNQSNSRLYVENHKPSGQTFSQWAGLHIFSDAEANENIGGMIQLQDKNSSTYAPSNKGLHVATSGLGVQYGAFINSTSNAGSTSPYSYGIHLTTNALGGSTQPIGLEVLTSANGAPFCWGVRARSAGSTNTNIGGDFSADGNNQNPTATNVGVVAQAVNLGANGTGVYTGVGPSNSAVAANSVHKGVDINVSTGTNSSAIQNLTQYGVKSDVRNLGIVSGASQDGKLYGVYSRAWNESAQAGGGFINFGLYATAETTQLVDGSAGTCSNIAVYGTTRQLNYGPQTKGSNSWAGFFDGDVYIGGSGALGGGGGFSGEVLVINGSALAIGGVWTPSDKQLKNNIKKLGDVSQKLTKLSGYTYNYNADDKINYPKTEQIGLLAQELSETFPQLVQTNKKGDMSINYTGMIPVLLEGFKEQQNLLEAQQKQISELKELVNAMATNAANQSSSGNGLNAQNNGNDGAPVSIKLSDKNVLVLNQNVPNPFAESTTISYNIPNEFSKAQLIFTTSDGKVIKVVDITAKGYGSINIFADDLSHGSYSYQLVIDGKIIDTKRMIKE